MKKETRKKLNRILARALMITGLLFLAYVGYMYYCYYFTNWQQ